MFGYKFSENNCFSKDAHSNAPSTTCAPNSAFSFNNAVITGIAAAVSVFFLIFVISIICYGIIIRDVIISAIMIIMSFIMYSMIIICKPNKVKYSGKTA